MPRAAVQTPYWETKDLEDELGLFKNKRLNHLKVHTPQNTRFSYFHSKIELIRQEVWSKKESIQSRGSERLNSQDPGFSDGKTRASHRI